MNKLVTTLAFIFYILSSSLAQHADNSLIIIEKRNDWLKNKKNELLKFQPDNYNNKLMVKEIVIGNTTKLSVRVKQEGLIDLNNGKWIFIVTNSSHNDQEIGDVSLAIDNKKKIYYNPGHICGGIIHFETKKLKKLSTTKEFFDYFICDTEGAAWEKFK